EKIVTKMSKHPKSLSHETLEQFDKLYQKVAQQLSYSRTYFPQEDVTAYLNGLVSTSHNMLYKDQNSSFKQIRSFFGTQFVALILEQWRPILIAFILFLIGAAAAFLSVLDDTFHLYAVLPANVAQSVD